MVTNDSFVMSAEDIRRQRGDALLAYDEALSNLERLVVELKTVMRRGRKIVGLIEPIEVETDQPLCSEAELLMLTAGAFDGFDFPTIRGLANAIAAARRELAEASETKRILGCR